MAKIWVRALGIEGDTRKFLAHDTLRKVARSFRHDVSEATMGVMDDEGDVTNISLDKPLLDLADCRLNGEGLQDNPYVVCIQPAGPPGAGGRAALAGTSGAGAGTSEASTDTELKGLLEVLQSIEAKLAVLTNQMLGPTVQLVASEAGKSSRRGDGGSQAGSGCPGLGSSGDGGRQFGSGSGGLGRCSQSGGGDHGDHGGGSVGSSNGLSSWSAGTGSMRITRPGDLCNACHINDSSSDGSVDEGAEEAARLNAYSQQMYAELQRPEVYQSYGLSKPPQSFMPPDLDTYTRSMRIIGVRGV